MPLLHRHRDSNHVSMRIEFRLFSPKLLFQHLDLFCFHWWSNLSNLFEKQHSTFIHVIPFKRKLFSVNGGNVFFVKISNATPHQLPQHPTLHFSVFTINIHWGKSIFIRYFYSFKRSIRIPNDASIKSCIPPSPTTTMITFSFAWN